MTALHPVACRWCCGTGRELTSEEWEQGSAIEGTDLRADAARYRWLREQDWFSAPLFVVRAPGKATLGSDCPSRDRLDALIDAAMQSTPNDGAP